jgi:peptide/nickel transport system substrate-binding protein
LLALLFTIACGTAAPEVPTDLEPPPAAGDAAAVPTLVAMPTKVAQITKPQGHLRIAYASLGSDGIYPKEGNVNAGGKDVQTTMYGVVVGSDGQGALSTETGLATDWSTTPDALHHTINLRGGVKFHNGQEVTAEDVKFSMEEVMEEDSKASFNRELTPALDNLQVPEPYTLAINCTKVCLFAPWIFSGVRSTDGMVVPKAHYEAVTEAEFAKSPVGSGPYQFGEQVLGASIRVEAVNAPHFRGGIPKYEPITFLSIPEEATRVAMLKSGEADIIDTSRERVDSLQKAGFNIFYKERADVMGAYFFQQWEEDPPFRDIEGAT